MFNKASMMNIGFLEAMTFGLYDCVIFHDVDMMLEDDRHLYRCSDAVRHMGANVNKFGYRYFVNERLYSSFINTHSEYDIVLYSHVFDDDSDVIES